MPDFDFDTRTPQGSNERNRPRMPLIANRLRSLFSAGKLRILSMAGTLRRSLMANKLRSLLIGGVVLFVIAPASVGLFIYSFGGFPHLQQEARQLDPRCSGNFAQSTENSNLGDDSNETQIAFTRAVTSEPSARGPESEIYVMNADGTNETRLTNTPESYAKVLRTSLVWSPDGKRIAYLRGTDVDSGLTDRDIYVINADGSNASRLTTVGYPNTTFAWSPDGEKIAFYGWTRLGGNDGAPGIYLINPDGTGLEYLPEGRGTFSWSPDSKKLAFVGKSSNSDSSASASASASDEDSDIFVSRTAGSDLTQLTNTPGTDESSPVWSPDGTKIAFSITNDVTYDTDISVMNADGSWWQDHLTDGSSPVWSPDSKKIAFLRGYEIYVMNADGSCETHLTNYNAPTPDDIEEDLVWSPDGEKIAFKSASSGNNDIYVINTDGSGLTNLTNSKESEDYVAWSPAGAGAITKRTQEAIEDREPIDSAPEKEALQAYIKLINELLAEQDLRGAEEGSEGRQLADNKAQRVLGGSDPSIKEKAVRFLARSELLPIIQFSYTDLRGTDMSGANLSEANWDSVNLSGVDLSNADLSVAYLSYSNLRGADLSGADLRNADLESADLSNADLSGAHLSGADLLGDDLSGAVLESADLRNADLESTHMRGTDLSGADLSGANLAFAQEVSEDQLAQTKSLAGATMPDETQHP